MAGFWDKFHACCKCKQVGWFVFFSTTGATLWFFLLALAFAGVIHWCELENEDEYEIPSGSDYKYLFPTWAWTYDLGTTIGYGGNSVHSVCGQISTTAAMIVLIPTAIVAIARTGRSIKYVIATIAMKRSKYLGKVNEGFDGDGITEDEFVQLMNKTDLGPTFEVDYLKLCFRLWSDEDGNLMKKEGFLQFCRLHKIKLQILPLDSPEKNEFAFALLLSLVWIFIFWMFSFALLDDEQYVITNTTIVDGEKVVKATNPGWESLYFTIVTFTTVGLGDIVPQQSVRPYFALMNYVGLVVVGMLLSATGDLVYGTPMEESRLKRKVNERIKALEAMSDEDFEEEAGKVGLVPREEETL